MIEYTKRRSKKKSTHVDEEKIIEEKENESQTESEKKNNNSFNLSFSVNNSVGWINKHCHRNTIFFKAINHYIYIHKKP